MNTEYSEQLSELRQRIEGYLSGYRLSHTLSVERECRALAKYFMLDESSTFKLQVAALLHDITKQKTAEEQLSLCREFGIVLRPGEENTPKILHARTGAYMARRDFPDLVDDKIFHAIYCHTTGCESMNLYDKLLYLADYIEPERTFESCVKLREYFYSRKKESNRFYLLNDTVILSLEMTVKELMEAREPVCADTVDAWNSLIIDRNHRKTGIGRER